MLIHSLCDLGGTVPSSLWPRGKTVSPRRRPASSGLRNRRFLQTEESVSLTDFLKKNKYVEKESNPLVYFLILLLMILVLKYL